MTLRRSVVRCYRRVVPVAVRRAARERCDRVMRRGSAGRRWTPSVRILMRGGSEAVRRVALVPASVARVYRRPAPGRAPATGRGRRFLAVRGSVVRVYRRVVPVAVRRLIGFDSKGIVSLGLWVTGRRHGVPRGAVALTYSKTQTALLATLLALSVAELVAVELLLRALGVAVAVRTPLLILDAYGVLIGVTVIASCVTRPHVVTTDELRIRYGVFFDLRVPRTRIASVRRVREYGERGAVRVADGVAVVAVAGQTSIVLELDGPVGVVRPFGRPAEITRVRFHADDPDTAVAVLRGEVAAVR